MTNNLHKIYFQIQHIGQHCEGWAQTFANFGEVFLDLSETLQKYEVEILLKPVTDESIPLGFNGSPTLLYKVNEGEWYDLFSPGQESKTIDSATACRPYRHPDHLDNKAVTYVPVELLKEGIEKMLNYHNLT